MYIPPYARIDDIGAAHEIMRAHDFAVLVTAGETHVTHIPLLLAADEGPHGTLYGHMARANPHGAALEKSDSIAIFSGPHAYISPSWYTDPSKRVPTWNYAAVHAHGRGQMLTEAKSEAAMARLVSHFEPARDWTLDSISAEYKAKLFAAITPFKIVLTRIEAKAKLDQNKPGEDRIAAAEALEARGMSALAKLMREVAT